MSHSHGTAHSDLQIPERTRRLLVLSIAPLVLATLVGLVVLWPPARPPDLEVPASARGQIYKADVVSTESAPCGEGVPGEISECFNVTIELLEGPDEGEETLLQAAATPSGNRFEPGETILVNHFPDAPAEFRYSFADYERGPPLLILGIAFGIVVVLFSRWKGLAALVGLAITLFVLVRFLIPAILAGSNAVLATVVAAASIMLITLYLAHGFNSRTTIALLGTLLSLGLTAGLAAIFVAAANFTGFASEEALLLQIAVEEVNLRGLLLGGVIIGALGVLDDVTVTQASATWELAAANPAMRFRELYGSAIRIGRDHISSTVNTLVLAYAGSSLPLLILFAVADQPLSRSATSEVVAEEIVRTLVGSIGLVASVPVTTALAAAALTGRLGPRSSKRDGEVEEARGREEWKMPRREREWREQ